MTPTPDVRAELETLLQSDTSRTGDVYRLLPEGMTDQQIAERLGVSTPNFVWNQRVILKTLLEGDVPRSPSVVAQTSRKIRTVMRADTLSPSTVAYLQSLLDDLAVPAPQATDDSTQTMRENRARVRLAMELLADEPSGIHLDDLYDLTTAVFPKDGDEITGRGAKSGKISFGYDMSRVTYAGWVNLLDNWMWLTRPGRQALRDFPEADALWRAAVEMPAKLGLEADDPEPTDADWSTHLVAATADHDVRLAARMMIDRGFGQGRSLIDPSIAAWSPTTVEDLRGRYNEHPDASKDPFLDKLERQMSGAPDATILLAAELIALLQLPLVNVGQKNKLYRTRRTLSWLDEPLSPGPYLSFAYRQGTWHGGTGSNTLMWKALRDLVNFLHDWWQLPEHERQAALNDPWKWSDTVRSPSLTMPSTSEALRYLAFPEQFLPIVNRDHKAAIRNAYLPGAATADSDLDRDLFTITIGLQERDHRGVDFYLPPYKEIWVPAEPPTSRAWLIRGSSVQGKNLVPKWLTEGFISLPATMLQPVSTEADRDTIAAAVQAAFANRAADYQRQKTEEYDAFMRLMAPGDLVLTTAEGSVYVGEITGGPTWSTDDGLPARLRRAVAWRTPSGIDYADLPDPLPARLTANENVTDLTDDRAVIEALVDVEPPPPPPKGIPAPSQELAAKVHLPLAWLQRVTRLMERRKALILFGPPGTGKTYVAQELAKQWTEPGNTDLVQFHPSVAYEDFVAGYRPVDRDGQVVFELRQGPFMRLAEQARDNPGVPHVLIIDEINRANLAKVFGELYFLLEYRDRAMTPLYTDDSNRKFTLPDNVYVIGTMNTADRSIALVDAAMRRRFAFVSMHADEEPVNGVLRSWLSDNGLDPEAADLLDELNRRIPDRDFRIGPSYLMKDWVHTDTEGLADVWDTDLLPLLAEHHAGESIDIEARYGLDALRKAVADE